MSLLLSAPRVSAALLLLAVYGAGCAWLWWRHRQALSAEAGRLAAEQEVRDRKRFHETERFAGFSLDLFPQFHQ